MENTIVGLFFESCALRNSVTTQTQEAAERERLFNSIETVPGNVPAVKKADWAVGSGQWALKWSANDKVSHAERVVPISGRWADADA